jgi:acetyl esterase/lipase
MESCVADAKSAIRWVRSNASRLGVAPNRIVASGGSAGGHLAVSTALLPGFDESSEGQAVSSSPDALVLFNPAVMLAQFKGRTWARLLDVAQRIGGDPEAVSPIHHVREGLPPTIIFHGRADQTIPYWSVELFTEEMTKAGNDCSLMGFEGEGHGFFNFRGGENRAFDATMKAIEQFLTRLGYLI